MNTPLETATPAPARTERVKVWDLPVRLFHWLMVLCFAGAWLTHDSDALRFWHVLFGYTLFGLLLFRLLWGLIGTRHARFASFVRGPRAIRAYVSGKSGRHLGHNPAGAVAIVLLLLLLLGQVISGWQMVAGPTGFAEFWEEAHEVLANATLVMVGLHLAGVLWSSLRHRENLVASLFHGKKRAEAGQEGIATSRVWVGALLLATVIAFCGFAIGKGELPLGLAPGIGDWGISPADVWQQGLEELRED